MSYWKSLLPADGAGIASFLIQVGTHGESVMYRLDKDGRPCGMAVGRPEELLLETIRARFPYAELRLNENLMPHHFVPGAGTYGEALGVLHGKSCARKARSMAMCDHRPVAFKAFFGTVPWDDSENFRLTELALEYDRKYAEEMARPESS